MDYTSTQGLLFLTYLTNYSISAMMRIIERNPPMDKLVGSHVIQYTQKEVDKALASAEEAVARMTYLGITPLPYHDPHYPILLHEIGDKPLLLYYKGAPPRWEKLAAVVGSRKISPSGEQKTKAITSVLCKLGFGIVSGLALGVDTIAHEQALAFNAYTIAVLPHPLDTIYPKQNYDLANRILDAGGTLICELPFGINRGKKSFVARNRIQSGISSLVVPTELRVESGTMHTVRFAYQAKRPVCLPIYEDDSKVDNGLRYILSKRGSSPQVFTISHPDQLEEKLNKVDGKNPQIKLF